MLKLRFYSFFVLALSFASGSVLDASQTSACIRNLAAAGQLIPVTDLLGHIENMKLYFGELEAFHRERGTTPYAFSTPAAALALEAQHGPIITMTTYSRELNAEEHLRVATHTMGFLSSMPVGGVIVASGGTMGDRNQDSATGGGVGILQNQAMSMGFKTLSITAASAFKYRAAPADYLLYSLGSFGSESQLMYENSRALVVVGGGGQAYIEAVEYLTYNPNGILVFVDDPQIGGSSASILNDPRFKELAAVSRNNILIARSGSEAGLLLAEKLSIKARVPEIANLAENRINVLSADADLHLLLPGSRVIGFSGWSNFSRAGADLQNKGSEIADHIKLATEKIHRVLSGIKTPLFYATAGNDPKFETTTVAPFETMVHELSENSNIRYLALTAASLNLKDLSRRISAVSFVSPNWDMRTLQMVVRLDALITAGGNTVVLDQGKHAALLQLPHIHIRGANTLTDMRVEKIKNPKLKILSAAQILSMSDAEILAALNLSSE